MSANSPDKSLAPAPPGRRLAFFPADASPRLPLFFFAVVLQLIASGVSGSAYTLHKPALWLAGTVLWILWFILAFFIVVPRSAVLLKRFSGGLKKVAVIIFAFVLLFGVAEGAFLSLYNAEIIKSNSNNTFNKLATQLKTGLKYNDGTALSQQAGENLLKGENPYAHGNIVEALLEYNGAYDRVTPLRVGHFADIFPYPSNQQLLDLWNASIKNPAVIPPELETHICYPAGTFLLEVPFLAMGIKDIRYVYDIFIIGGLILAVFLIPGKRRWLFIAVALISLELWNTLASGETGILIFPFLLIAWMTIGKHNLVSAIFMGIAVATKQTAWFFLPFYLILVWQTSGNRAAASYIGIIAGIFIAANGYFIALDAKLWLKSITSPMVEPMFPLGVGAITLLTGGVLHFESSLPFTAMEILVLIGAVLWYLRYGRKYPETGPLLAILPLFFAWRSLWTYFFYVGLIILGRMLTLDEESSFKPLDVRGQIG